MTPSPAELWDLSPVSGECPVLYERCEHCLQYVLPGEPVRGRQSQVLACLTGSVECPDEEFAREEIPAHRFCERVAQLNVTVADPTPDFTGGLYVWLDRLLDPADRDLCYAYAFRLNEYSFEEAWDDDACVLAQILQHRYSFDQADQAKTTDGNQLNAAP